MENIIEVKNLCKKFGDLEVLKGVTHVVKKGEVVSIIGSSGSGKSTFLRCLNLLETPTSGSIYFEGSVEDCPQAESGKCLCKTRQPADLCPQGSVPVPQCGAKEKRIQPILRIFRVFPQHGRRLILKTVLNQFKILGGKMYGKA